MAILQCATSQEITKGFCQCGCGGRVQTHKGQFNKFILYHHTRGKNHPRWNEGKRILKGGYVGIKSPNHPRANKLGYVAEHILLAEKAMAKSLPKGL